MNDKRPDPDALLRRVAERDAAGRGRLKLFFGASAGVGKTYAMLEAARRKKAEGVDVVAGWVETHGRAETAAMLEGLEVLPPRKVTYHGTVMREFDLDAALARRPTLLLLDELAHTNAPGGRHAKRFQDALELLDAGIDVWTTLNVQHLGSLSDLVSRITEAPIREIVPDHLLDEADEVELIDLPPEDLLQRLREGKVYVPEDARRALESFFRKGNLSALRELALRRTADRVDEDVRDYRRAHAIEPTWPVTERILVCVRPNPDSSGLVQAGRRLAARLHAEWIVVHVESASQLALSDAERQMLAATFKLAEDLGAQTTVLRGERVSDALVAYARTHNISKIVLGKPARPRWRDRIFGSPVDAIVRGSDEIDVYVVSGMGEPARERAAPKRQSGQSLSGHLGSMAVVVACTLVCWGMAAYFDRSNLIMVYLLGVAFAATRFGRWPAVTAACLSVAAFDFFFVPPYWTFAITDTQYVVTFAVMLLVAVLISTLAVRSVEQAEAAHQRGRRTQLLYDMSRELSKLAAPDAIARAGACRLGEVFRGASAVILPGSDGRLRATIAGPGASFGDPREQAVAEWVFRHGRIAGCGTETLSGAAALYVPLPGSAGPVGVLGVSPHEELLPLSPAHRDLLETLARLIAAPLERARLLAVAQSARLEAEAERLRNTLLSSVSHDLRTPLAAITGAASSLASNPTLDDPARRELAEMIHEEAEQLNRLVSNLLDMTRLESGAAQPVREWHSIEEILGSATRRVKRALEGRRLLTRLAPNLPLLRLDATLIEEVFVNLLDNATRYSPPGASVTVSADVRDGEVQVEVADDGPGLPEGSEERVFDKFYRKSTASKGFGLGLAICRAVVEAHGGRIWAENLVPRGVAFRFTLPSGGTPDAPPEDGLDDRSA